MSSANILEFIGRDRKANNHTNCHRQWNGLGFNIICSCMCHQNKKEAEKLAQVWDPDANTSCREPPSKESIQEDEH